MDARKRNTPCPVPEVPPSQADAGPATQPADATSPEAFYIMTPKGPLFTDAGRADARRALAEYLASCEIPQSEWPGIVQRASDEGGSNLDLERETQRWLHDHGRVMMSATLPYIEDEDLARIGKRFRRKAIGHERVKAHLDMLDRRDAKAGAIPPVVPAPSATLGKEARALALLTEHPEWTDAELARNVPCNRTSLYRFTKYVQARELLEQGRMERPRGSKSKDGDVEAWNDE